LHGEKKAAPHRTTTYRVVRSHQAVRTAGFPFTQERRAGPIARVLIVSTILKRLKRRLCSGVRERLYEKSSNLGEPPRHEADHRSVHQRLSAST
jgi:hypothetical protein